MKNLAPIPASIPFGKLDSTSTATVMTATVNGVDELRSGVCMWLMNGVITSAENFTININGLGAKPVYQSQAAASRATTLFDINYTALLIYNADRVDGGCWDYVSSVPTKTSDLTNDSGYITGMYIASYGSSTYAEVLAAYKANKVVYCRASSNSNPGTGSQNRMAFLAYVNNSTTPTEMEFQYYRSVSSHSDSQQGDQVYVYKLNSSGTWSVTTREAYTKINPSTGLTKSYSNGVLTVSVTNPLPTVTASDNGKVLTVVNGAWAAASLPVYNGGVS